MLEDQISRKAAALSLAFAIVLACWALLPPARAACNAPGVGRYELVVGVGSSTQEPIYSAVGTSVTFKAVVEADNDDVNTQNYVYGYAFICTNATLAASTKGYTNECILQYAWPDAGKKSVWLMASNPPHDYRSNDFCFLSNKFEDVYVLKVDVLQAETNVCWKMTNANLALNNSYWGNPDVPGATVDWSSSPAGLSPASGSGSNFTFNPSLSTPTTYVVTARASLLTNCLDVCTVTVFKVDLDPDATNVCVGMAGDSTLNLINGSYWGTNGVVWSGTNGLKVSAVANDHLSFTPSNSTPTSYVVRAAINGFTNCFDTSMVVVLNVDFEDLISDQFSGIEVNRIAATDPVDAPGSPNPNSPLPLGVRSTSDDARVIITGRVLPAGIAATPMVGVRENPSAAVYGGGVTFLDSPAKNYLVWTQSDTDDADDEVVAGVDMNGNGVLDSIEVCAVFPHRIRAVCSADYNYTEAVTLGAVLAGFSGVGQDFLGFFLYGAYGTYPVAESVQTITNITVGEQTHALGQSWTASGNAACFRHSFAANTWVSKGVAAHDAVVNEVKNVLLNQAATVLATLAASPNTQESFGPFSFSVPVDFAMGGGYLSLIGNPEGQAFGHVQLQNTSLLFTVRKSDRRITLINYSGKFDDVYDFNIDSVPSAAKVQAGYNTIGTYGRTFKSHVDFSRTDDETGFVYSF